MQNPTKMCKSAKIKTIICCLCIHNKKQEAVESHNNGIDNTMIRRSSYQSTPAAATVILTDNTDCGRHPNKLIVVLAVRSVFFSSFCRTGRDRPRITNFMSSAYHATEIFSVNFNFLPWYRICIMTSGGIYGEI